MNKYYMTLGQSHCHRINGKTIDKDSVAVIQAEDYESARKFAFLVTENGKFHRLLDDINKVGMEYFPRGLIEIN